jgi:hypothetical protein
MRTTLLLALLLLSPLLSAAQGADSTKGGGRPSFFDKRIPLLFPCGYAGRGYPEDKVGFELSPPAFRELVRRVFQHSVPLKDTVGQTVALLKAALQFNDTVTFCFSPFLGLLDTLADIKNAFACTLAPWGDPKRIYKEYCAAKDLRFITLFYVEFVVLRRLVLNHPDKAVVEVALRRKGGGVPDYDQALRGYIAWLERGGHKAGASPRPKDLGHKWKLKVTKNDGYKIAIPTRSWKK